MESVASNSSPPPSRRRRRSGFLSPPPGGQPFADRVVRALHHRLLLLHRRDAATFFVLGATANVYRVTLSLAPSCTCPDRAAPCKHILFVLIRALGVPLADPCLRRRALRPCQLDRLLAAPTLPESLAGAALRRRFHQLLTSPDWRRSPPPPPEFEEGTSCPVCLEEMGRDQERVVACATCRNPIHEECLMRWKRSGGGGGRRAVSCVICRARWRDGAAAAEAEKYLNLAAYVDEDAGNDDYDGIVDYGNHHDDQDLCGG